MLEVIAKVMAVILRKQNVPENEIQDMVDQVKRRQSMALFDGWKGFDYQAVRNEGKVEERENGIEIFIKDKFEDEIPTDKIVAKLQKNYNMTEETAKKYVQKYSPVATDK